MIECRPHSLFHGIPAELPLEFSETLAQHQQAVRKYQLRRRNDYRSTPEKQ